jgi:hypothetical protein
MNRFQPDEPLYGVRGWRPRRGASFFGSTGMEYGWPDPEITAVHLGGWSRGPLGGPPNLPHCVKEAPTTECTICGIYAYSTLEAAAQSCYTGGSATFLGVVVLWGRVFAAPLESGPGVRFRAQHARVLAVERSDLGARAGDEFGLPQVDRSYLLSYAAEHGRALPHSVFEDTTTAQ